MIEDNAMPDPVGSGAQLLAEVLYAVEQLPPEPSAYPAIYDLAVACDQCGFFESSLVLYDRCLRIAISDEDRQTAYANLTAAYWAAAAAEPDPERALVTSVTGCTPPPQRSTRKAAIRSGDLRRVGAPLGAVRRTRSPRVAAQRCAAPPDASCRAWVATRAGGGHGRRGHRPLALIARHDRVGVDRRGQGVGRGSGWRRLPAPSDCGRSRRAVEPRAIRRRPRGSCSTISTICTPSCTSRRPIAGRTFVRVSTGCVRRRLARPMD